MLKAHRLVFDNKKEVVPFILRFLDQSQEVAERSYELLVASLSRNGEITEPRMGNPHREEAAAGRGQRLYSVVRGAAGAQDPLARCTFAGVLGESGKDRSEIMPARYSDS
jgi:hypothetical protein